MHLRKKMIQWHGEIFSHFIKREKIKYNYSLFLVAAYIFFIICMAFFQGTNLYIPIHDSLDNNIVQYKVLYDSHQFFSGADAIVDYMGGIDRDFLPSELKIYSLPFIFLEPFAALVLLHVVRMIVSVAGGLYLGKFILKGKEQEYRNIIVLCSFIYGILPSSPVWDLCFAIYPFFFAQIYRLYNKDGRLRDALILFIFSFCSELAHFGVFLCGYLLLLIIYDWFIQKKPNKLLIIALTVMSVGYIASEYRMFRLMFLKHAVTIRTEFEVGSYTIKEMVLNAIDAFINSEYHCATLHREIVLPICILYLGYLICSYVKKHQILDLIRNPFFLVMIWILLNAFLYGLNRFTPFKVIFTSVFPFMDGIQIGNALRINSFLWYFELAYVLIKIRKANYKKLPYIICAFTTIMMLFHTSTYSVIKFNLMKFQTEIKGEKYNELSYKDFYSENLFDKIKEEINYKGEWSVAFGMHPAVLSYNQIATLDGYHSWYTLDYKHKFRDIIAPELDISEHWREYYDGWGGRAYIFSEEVQFDPCRDLKVKRANININVDAFKAMGGKYIFSRVEISNANKLQLELKGMYTDEVSPYIIYVYEAE